MTADEYINGGMPVEGWFLPLDAWMMMSVDAYQRYIGTRGDFLEIGAYLGKSAVLLGYLARADEVVHVCDLFEGAAPTGEMQREYNRSYQGLSLEHFLSNYERFHPKPAVVHVGPSSEQLPILADGSLRLIHVDGSHSFEAVSGDIAHARRLLGPGGIVVFDDMNQRHTPGVAAAVWDAVLHRDLKPLALSTKLYATWDHTIDANDFVAYSDAKHVCVLDRHDIVGHDVVEITDVAGPRPGLMKRVARQALPPGLIRAARSARDLLESR